MTTIRLLFVGTFLVATSLPKDSLKDKAAAEDIRAIVKRNAKYQKLSADSRIASAKQTAFLVKWSQDCQSIGKILGNAPGDGRIDCIDKPPAPQPITVPSPPKVQEPK